MAKMEEMIPFLVLWETGVKDSGADPQILFEKARAKGVVCDPDDHGGATVVGVTLATYSEYRRRKGLGKTAVSDLAAISYEEWFDVLKTMFWDRWLADRIMSQSVANMLVDWVWTSGTYGITIPQKILGVRADGIVGEKTLAAVNAGNPESMFAGLKQARIDYTESICRRRPANRKFRNGWLRRINAI